MRANSRRFIFLLLSILVIVAVFVPCLSVRALAVSGQQAADPSQKNVETGYTAVIVDDAELLSSEEERELLKEMVPLTNYANIAVYTVATPTNMKDYERARAKRVELFGKNDNAAVFMVDMYLRRIIIQRRGNMEKFFNNSRANNITNNVAPLAKKGDYFGACKTAMQQMLAVIEDRNVPQPMKYLSNGVIALMLGCLTSFVVAIRTSSSVRRKKKKDDRNDTGKPTTAFGFGESLTVVVKSYRKDHERNIYHNSSSRGGSSCSSCGGGSSCSSCGGGSSCGSSCGGSSF